MWTCLLQFLLGLDALGHDVFWLELLQSTGDGDRDQRLVRSFLGRFREYGFEDRCALLLYGESVSEDERRLASADPYGMSRRRVQDIVQSADLLWNFCGALRQPLLSLFKRRVLIDLDPGILQVSALTYDLSLRDHHVFMSVGGKLRDADCEVPTLGLTWHPFLPVVYLPMWKAPPDPGPQASFSSVVHWYSGELWLGDRALSMAKRDGYRRYAELPQRAGRPFELAAIIYPDDQTDDREVMLRQGWSPVDPYRVVDSPSAYQRYIERSRAEIACPKPIYRELKTGWLSDRSACYLASGRPVLAEEIGFSDHVPTGGGLVAFRDVDEAVWGVADIDANYERHMRAARELAEEFLDSRRCLAVMLAVCG
jgi:hypothetical protein